MIAAKTSLNRAALKGGAATFVLALLATPLAVSAQTTAAAAANEDAAIIVTGSLIKNPNLVSAAPVNVTTADTIALKASNVAEEVLRDIPGIVPSIGSAVNNGNGGASYVDLRGIGSNRNIVLLDGNRIVPSGLVGRVDLNNIPLALVQRVDTQTGAAVTTYGADAISGVVNFVTKQDFSGVDLSLGTSLTEKGDGATYRADLTVGGNFDDGKGNAVLSIGYQNADPVYQGARDFSTNNISSFTGGAGGSGTAIPARFSGIRPWDTTTGAPSTVAARPNATLQYDPALGYARPLYAPFNFNPYNIFQTPFKRFNIFATAKYDVSDALTFYTRGLFSKNTVNTIIAPSGSFGSSVTINLNNPLLQKYPGLIQQFCAANIGTPTNYIARYTPAECQAARTATGTSDPNYRTFTGNLSRRTTEVGPRVSEYTTTVFDYRAGLKGKITDAIDFDVSGSYGESENRQVLKGYVLTSKVRNSLLINPNGSCISTDAGCLGIDFFGPAGSITPAGAQYITGESSTVTKATLAQVRGIISGDAGFALPWATDQVGFAIGAEYRDYFASQRSDSLAKQAGELGGAGGAAPDITGGFDVKEIYGELIAPIVQDKPFFENLTLQAGARYSGYSVHAPTNPRYNTFTWKAGATWEVVQGFKLRGNYSKAVRAPNINELFAPTNTGLTNLGVDPCAGAAPTTNANLRAVCLAQGAPATSIGAITNPTAGQANATSGGNLNLKPETAKTWTVGTVLQPTFAPGLSITVDYYNIKVTNAITTPLPGDAVNACFGNLTAASATDVNCTIIRRNPSTGGLDGDPATTGGLFLANSNSGTIKTNGIDLIANYSRDIGFAKLGLQGNFNYTFSQKFQAAPGGLDRECIGYYSPNCSFTGSLQPKIQTSLRTSLAFDEFDVSFNWRHIDGFQQEPQDVIDEGAYFSNGTVNYGKIPSKNYFDFTGRVNIVENVTIILSVSNLLNTKPPLVGSNAGSTSFNSGNTFPSTFDALGRRYAIQVRTRF